MKHLKSYNESRKDEYLKLCWHYAEIGDVLDESDIYQYVEQIHRNEEDFQEGDLIERIEQFSKYKLMEIPIDDIDIDEFYLDDDYMDEYKSMTKDSSDYPPIVLNGSKDISTVRYKNGKYVSSYTIIDGTHRVNALDRLGYKNVKAWVGIK